MILTPDKFTNVDDAIYDQNDIFYKEYANRVEDWEMDEDVSEDDFAAILWCGHEDFDTEYDLDWNVIRYQMWYTCGVYLDKFADNDLEDFCEWYNTTYAS